MNVKTELYGHAAILNCKGELSEDALEVFAKEVDRHLAENVTDVIVNLQEVSFVDSAALEHLLDLQQRLRQRSGRLTLSDLNDNVRKIFEMTRLDGRFEITDDVTEAVRAI